MTVPRMPVITREGETDGPGCPSCGTKEATPIYALGRIEARFPKPSIEKEFAQAVGRADTKWKTDQQAFRDVLAQRENRYLARQLCWVLSVQGLETYLLMPRDPSDYDLLIQAIRPAPGPADLDVVIGMRGPVASYQICNGLMVPIVVLDQIYSFDRQSLIKAIPRPETIPAEQFEPAAGELFDRILQVTDNAGATDSHRALNYCAVRYPAIYALAAEYHGKSSSLTEVGVRPSRLSGSRKVVDVIFSFGHRKTDVTEKYFTRVDVTDEFPFLVTKLSPYYDR
jgi:hypothetical protein